MTRYEVQKIATEHNLGCVHFQFNIAQNTGREFEVGYIARERQRVLFCKRQPYSSDDGFYLCNEFSVLTPVTVV